jgi:ABC-type bacteriocin/lantibiotic exporter with double-glycine peptidase domain
MMKRVLDTVAGWVQSIDESRDDDAVLLDVSRSVQADGFSCGAQSALMVLRLHGKGRSIDATIRALDTDEDGTSIGALLKLLRKRRLRPVIKVHATLRDLERGIDDGAPSVVSLDSESHLGVVFGYSSTKVYLADPSIRRSIRVGLSLERFHQRWDRWAMIVSSRSRR